MRTKISKNIITLALALVLALGISTTPVHAVGALSLNKTSYAAGEKITVTVTGITEQMIKDEAWVSIFKAGSAHNAWGEYHKPQAATDTLTFTAPSESGSYEMRLYSKDHLSDYGQVFVTQVSFTVGNTQPVQQTSWNASSWAKPELEKAQSYGLIPDALKDVDFKKPITRIEFAAVSVKLYENLTGKTASPVASNPFKDTNDVEVLKAYNIGLTAGTAADTFSPNTLLNREQAATMLTRAIKASYINGWTLANDNAYTLNFMQPAKFADDAKISDWAKPSVYYANANNIIAGTGNNMFSPADSATREQAIAIACRMVDNLKGKPIDYNGGTTEPPSTTEPPKPPETTTEPPTTTQPPETTKPPSGDSWIVGMWRYDTKSVWYAACQIFYADGSCFSIGIREYSYPTSETNVDVVKGKYLLSGDTLTVYEATWFRMKSTRVYSSDFSDYAKNYNEIVKIVKTGSRSEVEKLIDPNNVLYIAYRDDYGEWGRFSDKVDELVIVDANKFQTSWSRDKNWILERVQE